MFERQRTIIWREWISVCFECNSHTASLVRPSVVECWHAATRCRVPLLETDVNLLLKFSVLHFASRFIRRLFCSALNAFLIHIASLGDFVIILCPPGRPVTVSCILPIVSDPMSIGPHHQLLRPRNHLFAILLALPHCTCYRRTSQTTLLPTPRPSASTRAKVGIRSRGPKYNASSAGETRSLPVTGRSLLTARNSGHDTMADAGCLPRLPAGGSRVR